MMSNSFRHCITHSFNVNRASVCQSSLALRWD
jgi:hypothetical protein